MEKKHKIIVVVLIIIIIALVVCFAYVLTSNNTSNNKLSDDMETFNFDGVFTMSVPKNSQFLKSWNNSDKNSFEMSNGYQYYDKKNGLFVTTYNSPFIKSNSIDILSEGLNKNGNVTVEHDGNLTILQNSNNTNQNITPGKVQNKYLVLIGDGNNLVMIGGTDLNLLKSMANSIKFC